MNSQNLRKNIHMHTERFANVRNFVSRKMDFHEQSRNCGTKVYTEMPVFVTLGYPSQKGMQVTRTDLLPGDKLATWKDTFFLHPLIYVGNGWLVEKTKTGQVRERHVSSLPTDGEAFVMQRPHPSLAPSVVQRALSRLGREPYDLLTSNCQHFANEVLNGERKSEQVEAFKAVGFGLLVGCAIAALLRAR